MKLNPIKPIEYPLTIDEIPKYKSIYDLDSVDFLDNCEEFALGQENPNNYKDRLKEFYE